MNIVFFGTDDFAESYLDCLVQQKKLRILAIVAPPNRKQGRGMEFLLSPVAKFAAERNIELLQPEDPNSEAFQQQLKNFHTDLFVVIAYGCILKKKILDIPKIMSINVHGSLLPKYRGAAPINWAIINGEEKTGITIMKMNAKMDAGPMISQKEWPIKKEDTTESLRLLMRKEGPMFLKQTINDIKENNFELYPQDESLVSYAPKVSKDMGLIDWNKSAKQLDLLIRGLYPKPGTFTFYNQKRLKIIQAVQQKDLKKNFDPGTVCYVDDDFFLVQCGEGILKISRVHMQASKEMECREFLRGHSLTVGEKLG